MSTKKYAVNFIKSPALIVWILTFLFLFTFMPILKYIKISLSALIVYVIINPLIAYWIFMLTKYSNYFTPKIKYY